jgi:hypothetical protein
MNSLSSELIKYFLESSELVLANEVCVEAPLAVYMKIVATQYSRS